MSNLRKFLTPEELRLYRNSFLLKLMEDKDFEFICVKLGTGPSLGGTGQMFKYSCIFTHAGKSITTEYSKGLRHVFKNGPKEGLPIPAMPHEVMGSLIMEGIGVEGQTFEDWANDFGYNTDSRKAYATWQQILDNTNRLRGLWGSNWDEAVRSYQLDTENGLF